jgi:hypothetical protein
MLLMIAREISQVLRRIIRNFLGYVASLLYFLTHFYGLSNLLLILSQLALSSSRLASFV